MTEIHPAAHVDAEASLGRDVRVGPGAVVGAGVHLGDGVEVGANVVLEGRAQIGAGCRIFPGAVVGTEPQVGDFEGPGGSVVVGAGTIIRETATIHRSLSEEGTTRVGEACHLMTGAHVAHDCILGDRVILTNWIALGGHVELGEDCFVTHAVGIHQFVRVGEGALLLGPSGVRKEVPPFTMVEGHPPRVRGLNAVGLRRRGVSAEVRRDLKRAYRILFQEADSVAAGIARIEAELPLGREIRSVIEFLRTSKRGVYQGRV